MSSESTDRIEKQRVLRAPRSRVWSAIADAEQFGAWFRVRFAGPFRPMSHVVGHMTEPGFEGMEANFWIERIEPEHTLTFRWHPYAGVPDHDYSAEPKTLVTFTLADHPDGTALTIVESGFDALPPERRASAWRMNEGGWSEQVRRIAAYVDA